MPLTALPVSHFFSVPHRSPVYRSQHMALFIWKLRKLLLAHAWPMGATCFHKGCWVMLTSGLWKLFSFSSSNWRNKHKQSAWDTMSTYIDESDLSGDETFDDIGNFDIVNLSREEINNRECSLELSLDRVTRFRFWGILTGRCSRFSNLGYFYSCINNWCFKFI